MFSAGFIIWDWLYCQLIFGLHIVAPITSLRPQKLGGQERLEPFSVGGGQERLEPFSVGGGQERLKPFSVGGGTAFPCALLHLLV